MHKIDPANLRGNAYFMWQAGCDAEKAQGRLEADLVNAGSGLKGADPCSDAIGQALEELVAPMHAMAQNPPKLLFQVQSALDGIANSWEATDQAVAGKVQQITPNLSGGSGRIQAL